jgi:regulator of protease activity HflC (stomatin/prohibitin superfamily)
MLAKYLNEEYDIKPSTTHAIEVIVGLVIVAAIFIFGCFRTIGAGEIGIVTRLGEVNRVAESGLMIKIPFVEQVVKMDTRIQKKETKAGAATSDLQDVEGTIALNYSINKEVALKLYKEVGVNFEQNIIEPVLSESFKAGTAKYTAEGLITNRAEAKEAILTVVKDRLAPYGITVADLNIVNLDFSKAFNDAIEAKAVAQKEVEKAKQELEKTKIEAEKKIKQAEAEAEAQRLQQSTLTDLMVKKMLIEKWDGHYPTTMAGNADFLLNLGN